jgi:hypothetical protein
MRFAIGLVVALLMVIPGATQAASIAKPARLPAPASSRCGGHVVEVVRGGLRVDGELVKSSGDEAEIVVAPAWRRGCGAVAWVELRGTQRRLIVVPSIGGGLESLSWALPPTIGDERIFWVGHSRIAIGVAILQPRAMASWS